MICPFCADSDDKVVDSRFVPELNAVRRRRECLTCASRFTTYERVEEITIKVVKLDGTRQPFDRNKIRAGVERACWKRPISEKVIDELVKQVEQTIEESSAGEVLASRIGQCILDALHEIDQVAYVRFASVYRRFQNVNDFVNELKELSREKNEK